MFFTSKTMNFNKVVLLFCVTDRKWHLKCKAYGDEFNLNELLFEIDNTFILVN